MAGIKRVAIVTGSNKGIGFAIVKQLCQQFQGTVYLTSRDEGRGKAAVEELEKIGLKPKFHPLDIDSLDSIKALRSYFEKTYGGIDVLVNNAAIAFKHDATEPFGEQAENTIRVNFFGTLNVCRELFPLLRKHARVVHISSSEGHLLKICGKPEEAAKLRAQFSHLNATEEEICRLAENFVKLAKEGTHYERGWPNSTYKVSKVALSALVPIQQRFFDKERPDDDIIVNSVHPGYVDTDMTSHKGSLTIDEGASAPVWLAVLPPNVTSPRGAYIWCNKAVVDWTKETNSETPFQILVSLPPTDVGSGTTLVLSVKPTDTVCELLSKVSNKLAGQEEIFEDPWFSCCGRPLLYDHALEDYNISQGSTLFLHRKLSGGGITDLLLGKYDRLQKLYEEMRDLVPVQTEGRQRLDGFYDRLRNCNTQDLLLKYDEVRAAQS